MTFLLFGLSHLLTWIQMNLQFVEGFEWLKNYKWALISLAIPIAWMFMKAIEYGYEHYGALWPTRIIGFSVGNMIFALMAYLLMTEGMNTKTIISLVLSFTIIGIQVLWK